MQVRYLWRLLKISWKSWNLFALIIFLFKIINLIRFFRRGLLFIFLTIHWMLFFDIFGWAELFGFYFLLIEVSGPQIDKYRDFDINEEAHEEEEIQSFDYVLPKEEDLEIIDR